MSKPRKLPPKNKPLPKAPSKPLPSAPSTDHNNHTKRSNTNTTATYTFQTNLNGSYTTNPSYQASNGGFTYTTTYYTTSIHPWAKKSKPLTKIPNKTQTPPVTSTATSNPYKLNNSTTTTTRQNRATTFDTLETMQTHQKRQPSYHNALPLNPTIVNLDIKYSINDAVDLNDNRQGIIRFIGEIAVELNGAIWYGIELTKPQGNCNGTLKGISYFNCGDNYGTFVEKTQIRWLTSSAENEVTDLDSTSRLHINDIVGVKRKKGKGQIRFIGLFGTDVKYGIELLDDMGVHSGVVNGKFYFTCGIYRGIFVNRTDLIHLEHYHNDEIDTLHNRSVRNIFTNLSNFNVNNLRNGDDDDCDSDDSIGSTSTVDTLMTVDDDEFTGIQLSERETDMAFTQILNKFKNVERTQPRPSKLGMNMGIDRNKLIDDGIGDLGIDMNDDEIPKPEETQMHAGLSLDLSETSIIEEEKDKLNNLQFTDVGCEIDDDFGCTIDDNKSKKMSIVVGMHNKHENDSNISPKNAFKLLDCVPEPILENINENEQVNDEIELNANNIMDMTMINDTLHTHSPEIPSAIATETETETETNNNVNQDSMMLTTLSPLGITPGHSPNISLNLDEDLHINLEDSHLKEIPDSPYDVNTNEREFANTATLIQLGCDHPVKLFKILKAMTNKLFQENMKYRILSAKSNRIRQKLLNYDGIEEFLNQLGFEEKDNGNKLECPLDQPPLSVLDSALNVCNDYINKCSRRRAVIDGLKRFNPIIESEEAEQKSMTPINNISIINPSPQLMPIAPILSAHPSAQEIEDIIVDKTVELIIDSGDINESDVDFQIKEAIIIEQEEELEELEDTFKLFDIIASITHEENSDKSARQIILLCYTTFTDSTQMFNCLDKRFFIELDTGNYKNKQWIVQTKVISFIQNWMRQYWEEDWSNPINQLIDCIELFFNKVKDKYCQNTQMLLKYTKLIEMLDKTMKSQRANARKQSISQSPSSQYSTSHILNMPSITGSSDKATIFDNKTYDFFKLNNIKIARQITILDQTYFGMIKARECLGQSWKKKNKYDIAYNICQFIDHFNRMSKWVQTRVLLASDAKKRGRTIKKFIKICQQLFILRNFQSLYAVYGALYSSCIIRLKKAWHYVPTKHLAKFEEFKVIFATKRNMANLRKLHREAYPPRIPYFGLKLQDLLSIEEGNRKRKDDGAVNFARLLRLSTVIDSILFNQKTTYKINLDKKLQQLIKIELSKNQNLSDEYIWKLSDKVKKNDDAKKSSNFLKFGPK